MENGEIRYCEVRRYWANKSNNFVSSGMHLTPLYNTVPLTWLGTTYPSTLPYFIDSEEVEAYPHSLPNNEPKAQIEADRNQA